MARLIKVLIVSTALLVSNSSALAKSNCADLINVAILGKSDEVKKYIEKGVDLNCSEKIDGDTALMWASYGGHLETVKMLVENGADVNIKSTSSATALMFAAKSGHLDIVKFLIENEADIRAKNSLHMNARMIAASKGHQRVVKIIDKAARGEFPPKRVSENE